MKHSLIACIVVALVSGIAVADSNPVAALFADGAFGNTKTLAPRMKTLLEATGYDVVELDARALCAPETLAGEQISLLVLPDAKRLPMAAIASVKAYLERGGDLIALNAPAWQERVLQMDGVWQTPEEYRERQATQPVANIILDFSNESMEDWFRSAYRMESPTTYKTVADGPAPGMAAFEVNLPEMEGWDSVCRNFEQSPFPEGHTVTVFSAKGGVKTNRLAVEWRERDGSRWIAVVPLTQSWQQFRLSPEDFKFWESVPARAGSALNPANVEMIAFTLAYTHTGHLHGGHWFQVSQVGTAAFEDGQGQVIDNVPAPTLEIVSPGYKFFDMSGAVALTVAAGQNVVPDAAFPLPAAMLAMHPRPEAGGYGKGRPWRWMPLLEARAADGDLRGYPAAMFIHTDGDFKGGVWASFAIEDAGWYASEPGAAAVKGVLARMKDPVFLVDGGAEFYTCFEGQELRLGATVANLAGVTSDGLSVLVEVNAPDGALVKAVSWTELTFPGGAPVPFAQAWKPEPWPDGGYLVTASLYRGEERLDRAEHELHCWRPKANPSYVSVQDGDFMLDGQRWRPHGVNYMPSSGIGTEWWKYFEQWMGNAAYSPKVIQRDLERCVAMGCNALSIFIYRESMEAQNLLDLLRRMDALGLKANLSLRPGTPMDLSRDVLRELIEYYRLAENDTVFAYDLAWEPQFRNAERDPFNPQWEAWIIERYGSVENAEQDWGCPVPRDADGRVANYTPEMISGEGPWDRMIAAYRRFLDTLLYEKYSEARRFVRSLDPNHHVSFRMSMAGDPTDLNYTTVLYDFAYLAGAVDILEPEAYGRIGDWEKVKPGRFTFEYGRWANPAVPVLWAEAGVHAWDMSLMRPGEEALDFQARYYTDFYRMLTESGADGIFWWWYPGGFRVNENSDYGIINPDGTDRPVTRVIRDHAEAFIQGPDSKPVDTWLTFDRDSHKNGLTGIYSALEETFWTAIAEGKIPGLRTEGTGTDSTNCPPVAVGNVPWTVSNPPKYLDACFDVVEMRNADGTWQRVFSGDSIPVDGSPVTLRLTITNLGEATLIAPENTGDKPGGVYITCSGDLEKAVSLPQDLARFESTIVEITLVDRPTGRDTEIILAFNARERTSFGNRVILVFKPRG